MSAFPLGLGGERLMPLVRSSLAPQTWQAYGKAWDEWVALVGGREVDSMESVRLEVTLFYLFNLREAGASFAMAQRRLTFLAFHFQLRGWSDVTKAFVIRQALKGWRKDGVRVDSRRPISYSLLARLLEVADGLCSSVYEARLFKASFCLAFFAALRVGELVPPSKDRPGGLQVMMFYWPMGPSVLESANPKRMFWAAERGSRCIAFRD